MHDNFEMKYRRRNTEWEKLPFQANGAGIAIYTTAITTLVSTGVIKAGLPAIIPCALYFIGLLYAYFVHLSNMRLDDDVDLRERANDAMQWVLAHENIPDLPLEIKMQIPSVVAKVTEQRKSALAEEKILQIKGGINRAYRRSLMYFLVSTAIIFAYFSYFLVASPRP